jgi:hypothetical protein
MRLHNDIIKSILQKADDNAWIKLRLTCKYIFNLADDGEKRCNRYIKQLKLEITQLHYYYRKEMNDLYNETPYMKKLRIGNRIVYNNKARYGNNLMYFNIKNTISNVTNNSKGLKLHNNFY